jgi:aspartate/methionine/tyrosine aminotransferase
MRREYDRRRKMIVERVREVPGWDCVDPQGAFYVFCNIKKMRMPSLRASEWLLKNAKVAAIPGTEFGRMGEGFIRLSYATAYEKIVTAMDRIEKAVKKR